jgi:hypothetical protein
MTVASGTRPAHAQPAKKPQRHPDLIVRKPRRPDYRDSKRPMQRAA